MSAFAILLIAVGVAVLLLGNRLPVLGAAVGALFGAVILRILPETGALWVQLAVVGGLALLGLLFAGFARGILDVVILVLGALGGAAIVLGFLDLFNFDSGILNWVLAVVGGVLGLMLIRRFRRGRRDYGMIILSSLLGALLVARGLAILIPSLQGSWIATLIVVALAVGAFAYQSQMFGGKEKKAATPAPVAAPAPTAKPTAAVPPSTSEAAAPPVSKEDSAVPPPSQSS